MTEIVNDTHTRVLVCDSVDQELLDGLAAEGYDVQYRPEISHEEILHDIAGFSVVVVRSRTKIDAEVIDAAENLRIIARAGIGIDNIDSESASEKGVSILTAAGASTQSVVELNLGLAIDLSRKISTLNRKLREGEYGKKKGREISGSTCGIIGFGRIGFETARALSSLGAGILAYDIVENPDLMKKVGGRYTSLQDLLSSSDYVFITVTLNGESRKLLGKEEFMQMKKGAFIINTSRAEALEGKVLREALEANQISGYASDVMWNEPPSEEWEKAIISMDNVVITPHVGAQTYEGQKRVAIATLENIKKAVRGGN